MHCDGFAGAGIVSCNFHSPLRCLNRSHTHDRNFALDADAMIYNDDFHELVVAPQLHVDRAVVAGELAPR
jgi:hypothetical protein